MGLSSNVSGSGKAALVLRSAALFAILWQFRLLAADLADTSVYAASLVCAFGAALILVRKIPRPLPAMALILLMPWVVRAGIALPRLFISGPAVTLDSLVFNLDRNRFVFLLPFYWAGLTTYFSARSRRFLRADIIVADTLLVVVFCIVHTADLAAYRWPILMIALFSGILFLQILAFMLSLPPEYALQGREGFLGAAVLFMLVCLGGILLIRPSQEGAVDKGGGLLEPNLFHFDFSQVLRLESEISMNDDLVFIVRKDAEDFHIYLRRFVLSGYNPKQGFYRHESIDEAAQPQRLPDRQTLLDTEPVKNFRVTNQEYFLVNFDSSALIALSEPVEITPFDRWDASSFNSAYAVRSHASEVMPFELIDSIPGEFSAPGKSTPAILGLTPKEYAYYTEYGGDERLAAFAREITQGCDTYWEKVQAVFETLKYGDYRYSLKPGIAPDGNQLAFFLFETKKGYCSYYAFAMTLLLRSLGIPARAAAGFFIDPELNTFNYYPVRSDMAHAWVEVRYPGYGWIEYDPTTTFLAEDEEFRFSSGVPQDLFERLMREILENRSRLSPKEGGDSEHSASALASLGSAAGRFLRKRWPPLVIILLCLLFLGIRTGYLGLSKLSPRPRKKAGRLWSHTLRRLRLAGHKRDPREQGEAEWVQGLDRSIPGIYGLYQGVAAARYAPEYPREQWQALAVQYRVFSAQLGKAVPPFRRVLAWILPPLALALRPAALASRKGPPSKQGRPGKGGPSSGGVALLLLILFIPLGGDAVHAQLPEEKNGAAQELYNQALDAQNAEFWDRAIELYSRGMDLYPRESRFPLSLGQLYYSRHLYGLAWDAYRQAEALTPQDMDLLYQLSQTASCLNETAAAAEYLERLLAIYPDNMEAIGNLAWMYYKLHRLGKGERLLLAAQERLGPSPDFAMTLGTIYSEMFRYEDAKHWYLEAIRGGEAAGDRTFTSVTHYNLSLLEARFYSFAEALDRTNASLAAQNRASGWLARGELFLRQLEFSRIFADYQKAYETDNSPLSKINLSQAYQVAGRLEEARLYAEDCLRAGDMSWMVNYGIDPVRYKRDIHQILWHTYGGLAETEALTPYGGLKDRARSIIKEHYYRFKTAVHRRLFQKYSLLSADAYGDQQLDALIQYYNAFESYPGRAIIYLNKAREFEEPLIPQSAYSYDAETGRLQKNRELLHQTVDGFDPLWERDMIAETYTGIALLAKGSSQSAEKQDAVERLYALNRGALRQNGLSLPVDLLIDPSGASGGGRETAEVRRIERSLQKILPRAGIRPVSSAAPLPPRFHLTVTITAATELRCELYDGGRGTILWQRSISLPSLSSQDTAAFARTLADTAFTVK